MSGSDAAQKGRLATVFTEHSHVHADVQAELIAGWPFCYGLVRNSIENL
jgi:hypothetical protein